MKIIKYQLETEINYGTPEEPDIETLLSPVTVTYTEEAYAIAQDEAYQGQITVEDGVSPPPPQLGADVVSLELCRGGGGGVVTVYDMARGLLSPPLGRWPFGSAGSRRAAVCRGSPQIRADLKLRHLRPSNGTGKTLLLGGHIPQGLPVCFDRLQRLRVQRGIRQYRPVRGRQ